MAATAKVLHVQSDALLARVLRRRLGGAMPHVELRVEPDVASATASLAAWTPDVLLLDLSDAAEWAAFDEIPPAEWGLGDVDPALVLGTSPGEWKVARSSLPLVAAWAAAIAPRPARVVATTYGTEGTPRALLDELHVVAALPLPGSRELVDALRLALGEAP